MNLLKKYIIPRIIQFAVVIFIGVTITFLIPRFTPIDPVQSVLNRVMQYGSQYLEPEALEKLRETLTELYGLKGTILDQYIMFWKHFLTGDFGPSLAMFPTPVMSIIKGSLPWTIILLIMSIVFSWIIGNILGGIAGYFDNRRWSKLLSIVAMSIYPIPYYIIALILVMLFAYIFPIFPIVGGFSVGLQPTFSYQFIFDVIKHAFLPSLSLIIVGTGWWFLSMRSLTATIISEDFIVYAEMIGLPKRKILFQYLMKNSMLPQITNLALQIGGIFNGALITEYVFSYPGLGQVLYNSVTNGDFNLMMGITSFSVITIAGAAFVVDLIYPIFDPRVRYK